MIESRNAILSILIIFYVAQLCRKEHNSTSYCHHYCTQHSIVLKVQCTHCTQSAVHTLYSKCSAMHCTQSAVLCTVLKVQCYALYSKCSAVHCTQSAVLYTVLKVQCCTLYSKCSAVHCTQSVVHTLYSKCSAVHCTQSAVHTLYSKCSAHTVLKVQCTHCTQSAVRISKALAIPLLLSPANGLHLGHGGPVQHFPQQAPKTMSHRLCGPEIPSEISFTKIKFTKPHSRSIATEFK